MKTNSNTRFRSDIQDFNDKTSIRIIQNITLRGCIYTVVMHQLKNGNNEI